MLLFVNSKNSVCTPIMSFYFFLVDRSSPAMICTVLSPASKQNNLVDILVMLLSLFLWHRFVDESLLGR